MATITNKPAKLIRIDIIKWDKTIAHIYNLNQLSYDRTINLLASGHTIKPVFEQAKPKA
jgi:hypothetical protein